MMNRYENGLLRAAEAAGTWMMISGFLVLGPAGLVLLGIFAWAMYISKMSLAVVCLMLLASPLVFMTVWILLMVAGRLLRGRRPTPEELLQGQAVWQDASRDDVQPFW